MEILKKSLILPITVASWLRHGHRHYKTANVPVQRLYRRGDRNCPTSRPRSARPLQIPNTATAD